MTPFAKELFDVALRTKNDVVTNIVKDLYDAQFFDITKALPYMVDLKFRERLLTKNNIPSAMFIPSPTSWIEWNTNDSSPNHHGVYNVYTGLMLLERTFKTETGWDRNIVYYRLNKTKSSPNADADLMGDDDPGLIQITKRNGEYSFSSKTTDWDILVLLILCVINRPRNFGRMQHDPHRGFYRKISQAGLGAGRFPLRAWTEITLPLEPIETHADDPPVFTGLTWKNPLHFVRKHTRLGREIGAHWRGDASIGIKRSRYVIDNGIELPDRRIEDG